VVSSFASLRNYLVKDITLAASVLVMGDEEVQVSSRSSIGLVVEICEIDIFTTA